MLFNTLFDIVLILFDVIQMLLIVYMIISLLIVFNVVNTGNQFVMSIYHAVDALLAPLLNPLRRVLPQAGGIDWSPLALIVLMRIVIAILVNYQASYVV